MYVYVCTHMYIIFMYRYSFCFGFVWNQQNRQIETRHYKEEKETLATVGESLSKDERNAFETPSLERKRRNRKGMEWLEGFWGKCPKSVCWNPISESQWRRAAGRHVNGSTSAFNQCFFFFSLMLFLLPFSEITISRALRPLEHVCFLHTNLSWHEETCL